MSLYIFYIYICIIASNDNNQCMQFVCPYCGPIDWNNNNNNNNNNKYSYSYSYTTHIRAKCIKTQFCHFSFVSFSNFYSSFSNRKREIGENAKISIFAVVVFFCSVFAFPPI